MSIRSLAPCLVLAFGVTLTLSSANAADQWSDALDEAEEEFVILDGDVDPLAADELDFDDPSLAEDFEGLQRAPAAVAQKRSDGGDDFDFEDEEEFAFEDDAESGSDLIEDFEDFDLDLDPMDDAEIDPLGDLESAERSALRDLEVGPAPPAAAASSLSLSVVGKTPLQDNYLPKVVATDRDSIVVELPVLLGRARADFGGEPYWLVAGVYVDGVKVAESRQYVTASSLAAALSRQ